MAVTDKSILDTVKKVIGIGPADTSFDEDVIQAINTAFSTLNQLGVGPVDSLNIEDSTTMWSAFIGDEKNIAAVKSYVGLRVKMLVDPPSTSFAIAAKEKQIEQMEWRLMEVAEASARATSLVTPDPEDTPPTFITYFTGDDNG